MIKVDVLNVCSAVLLMLASTVSPSLAQVDACDDYLLRHNRRDLVPHSISLGNEVVGGVTKQRVTITVKNVGERDLEGGPKPIAISINGITASTSTPARIRAGESVALPLYFAKGTFPIIGSFPVKIDLNRTAGQWGCAVFTNDTKTLSNGVIIRPIPRPPIFNGPSDGIIR